MWEPAIDIERLLGASSPAKSNNPFIVQERLPRYAKPAVGERRAWRSRICITWSTIICQSCQLWQVTDRFAYSLNCKASTIAPCRCTTKSATGG